MIVFNKEEVRWFLDALIEFWWKSKIESLGKTSGKENLQAVVLLLHKSKGAILSFDVLWQAKCQKNLFPGGFPRKGLVESDSCSFPTVYTEAKGSTH